MVVGAFPLVKLGALLLRQVSKPIANYIVSKAKTNSIFRKYICMPPAQLYNWCEIKTKMWILNLGKPVNIPVLNEAMAIELGANLLGEAIVFCMASSVLIAEYNRGKKGEEAKENARKEEMAELLGRLQELALHIEHQDAQLREISRRVLSYREIEEFEKKIQANATKKISPPPSEPPSPPLNTNPPLPDNSPTSNNSSTPDNSPTPVNAKKTMKEEKPKNIILKTTDKLLEELLGNDCIYKDSGLLIDSLRYLQYDVYKAPIIVK